jgi:hypothetical protein
MARYTDLENFESERKKINVIRERVSKVIYEALKQEFGEDFTRYIEKEIAITPTAQKVTKNTVIADVADVTDNGNCLVGICVEVSTKVKKWNTTLRENGSTQYGVTLDDYDTELNEVT